MWKLKNGLSGVMRPYHKVPYTTRESVVSYIRGGIPIYGSGGSRYIGQGHENRGPLNWEGHKTIGHPNSKGYKTKVRTGRATKQKFELGGSRKQSLNW